MTTSMILTVVCAGLIIIWWVVMLLWNAVMPVIFAVPEITYWQAAGLQMLVWILFPCKITFGGKR